MSETGLQGSHIAIIDPKTGRATNAFWRLLEALWRRTGGFSNILDDLSEVDAGVVALINSLESETVIYSERISRVDALTAGAGDVDEAIACCDSVSDRLNSSVPFNDEINFNEKLEEIFRIFIGSLPDEQDDFSIEISDEGNSLTTRAKSINFTGAGVTATSNAGAVTVDITGGSGGGGAVSSVFGRAGAVVAVSGDYDADQVDYDNTTSGLTATDVQAAIDEVSAAGGLEYYDWHLNLEASSSSGAQAFKGANFTVYDDVTIWRAFSRFAPVSGADYEAVICELNGSDEIQSITSSTSFTTTDTTLRVIFFEFSGGVDLTADTKYAIMIGRTDGANNFAMPLPSGSSQDYLNFPSDRLDAARIADAAPAVTDTIDTGFSSSNFGIGAHWSFNT